MADEKYVDNSPRSSNVDSLIEKLRLEISKESEDDFINSRKLTIQSTTNRQDMTNETAHDIDKEITELENLIKRLQAEIVEMTESANQPLHEFFPDTLQEENSFTSQGEQHISPIIKNEREEHKSGFKIRKGGSDVIFPVILKDKDMLEEQAKMFAENMSNSITISNNTESDNGTIDDVRRNFSVLWDDAPNSSDTNANVPKPTISDTESKPVIDPSLKESIPVTELKLVSNVTEQSDETTTIIRQVELTNNVAKVNDNPSLQDEVATKNIEKDINKDTEKDINKDVEKLNSSSTDSENIPKTVIQNISEIVNEQGKDNLPVPVILSNEADKNLPDRPENLPTVITDSNISDSSRPASAESKKSILKTSKKNLDVAASPSNTNNPTNEKILSTILPSESQNTNQAPTKTPEKPVSKSESKDSGMLKNVSKTLRKIVSRVSRDSITKDKNESKTHSSPTSDSDITKKNRKSKSKDSLPGDDKDKTIATAITQESPTLDNKDSHKSSKRNKSKSSISQSSIDKTNSKNSSEEKLKPAKTKSVTIKPVDKKDSSITKMVANEVQNKQTMKENLSNTVNTKTPINSSDGPQIVETENIFSKSEIIKNELPVAVAQKVSNIKTIPKAFSSDLTEDLKSDTKKDLEAAKQVNTVLVTEDFGTEVVEDELECEEDLIDEGDLPDDDELTPSDEQDEECAGDDDNRYDVD